MLGRPLYRDRCHFGSCRAHDKVSLGLTIICEMLACSEIEFYSVQLNNVDYSEVRGITTVSGDFYGSVKSPIAFSDPLSDAFRDTAERP